MRQLRLVAIGLFSFLCYLSGISSEIFARDTVIITHSNAPLGLGISDFERIFPRCSLSDLGGGSEGMSDNLEPITGYWPPFLDILPTFDGSFLGSPRAAMFSKIPIPSNLAPTLDSDVLRYVQAWCGDPNDTKAPSYDFVVFQSKIMVVLKLAADRSKASAEEAMEDLAGSLVGRRGGTHQATSLTDAASVLVTYADNGTERTILETEDSFQAVYGLVPVFVKIAYVHLPLWQIYSTGVIQKLQNLSALRSHASESIKNGL